MADSATAEVNPWDDLVGAEPKKIATPGASSVDEPESALASETKKLVTGAVDLAAKTPMPIAPLGGLNALDKLLGGGKKEARQHEKPAGAEPALTESNPWEGSDRSAQAQLLLSENTGLAGALGDFLKFGGHSFTRGLAEGLGMPVDTFNTAGEFLRTNPAVTKAIANIAGPLGLPVQAQLAAGGERGVEPVYTGSGKHFKDVEKKAGLPISTPKEEGVDTFGATAGDVLGEFVGANVPFFIGAPEKIMAEGVAKTVPNIVRIAKSKNPLFEAAHDHLFGALGPGVGALIGEEVAGPENEEAGKVIGGIVGATRPLGIEAALHAGKAGAAKGMSWLHDFLGVGTGAETKVASSLARGTQDLEAAKAALHTPVEVSPGAVLPTSVVVGDDGLTALVRTVTAKDAVLAGDYRKALLATQEALKADKELARGNFTDTQSWLDAKQKKMESLINQRASQAVTEAERNVANALKGTVSSPIDANTAKKAYADAVRRELVLADADVSAVTRNKWEKVDKTIPVSTDGVYDELKRLRAEHKARRGQSDARFPDEIFDRFFDEQGKKKFGPAAELQEVIDLDSEISQAMRVESAGLGTNRAPDPVYLGYLKRLQKALYTAKTNLPEAKSQEALRDALNATKTYHKTFSEGPVAQALGHNIPGAPNVFSGDTIKHFLRQGPGGVDAFDSLMKALQGRTGEAAAKFESTDARMMLEKNLRQDFADNAMANGHFDESAARQWMRNNAGGLNHFPQLRKEFELAAVSHEVKDAMLAGKQQELDTLRENRAALYLGNDGKKVLLGGALNGPNKYKATKELLEMTNDDPTGRATEGVAQSVLDHMLNKATINDRKSNRLEHIDGFKIVRWMDEHKGVVQALDEVMPGIAKRFERIENTARYIERFRAKPDIPDAPAFDLMSLGSLVARIMGARVGSHFGHSGGSIQTASIGSRAFKQIAEKLTPDETIKVLRKAMVEPEFFEALISRAEGAAAEGEKLRIIQPYMLSMGIPFAQSLVPEPQSPTQITVRPGDAQLTRPDLIGNSP